MTLRTFRLLRSAAVCTLASLLLSACGGGGGGGGGGNPPPANVTISGSITFDRIPFDAVAGNGLNPAATVQLPARQVTVQAIDASNNTVLATATTDTSGAYSVTVPANTNLFIRARAEMIKTGAPSWNFTVRNNANSDALYVLDGSAASSGSANSTRNLRATTGFGTTSYTGVRAAAPFAILDTVFRAKELMLTASSTIALPELRLFWSDENKPVNQFCPDNGEIGTTTYAVFGNNGLDDCDQPGVTGIYILGDFNIPMPDTDEFDESVIAHEFGHYVEDRFGRSDSIGGIHGGSATLLDLRVAFGEGWGNAFSGMALGSPIYRDSQEGMDSDFQFDLETDDDLNEGWFSEASVGEILWDLFDAANEPGDTLALGFAPLFSAVTSTAHTQTDAVTSIYTYIVGLRAANPGSLAAITTLVTGEKIFGSGDFATDETNNAGDPQVLVDLYRPITLENPLLVCSRSPAGNESTNKVGNRVLLRFENNMTRLVTISATGTATGGGGDVAATDPDIFVLRRGALAAFGVNTGGTETISQVSLPAGIYIIEVYDFDLDRVAGPGTRCMNVSVTGA